jgi:hypothetical protein
MSSKYIVIVERRCVEILFDIVGAKASARTARCARAIVIANSLFMVWGTFG